MSEIVRDPAVSLPDFKAFVLDTYADNLVTPLLIRKDKGGPNDRYIMEWDDGTGSPPSQPDLVSALQAWRAQSGNSERSRLIDQTRTYVHNRFHSEIESRIIQRVKSTIGPDPTKTEIRAAVDSEVNSLVDEMFLLLTP